MRVLVSFMAVLLLGTPVLGQSERYELGRRLKAFEDAWEKHENPAARARALDLMPFVTQRFFKLQLGEAGRVLDRATFALTTENAPSPDRQWVWSLSAIPDTRVVDGNAKELEVTIRPFYPVKTDVPKNLELQLWFTNKHIVKVKPKKFPLKVKVPLPPLGEFRGLDRRLYFLADGTQELRPIAIGISQIANLQARLDALTKAITKWKELETIEQATIRDRVRQLTGLMNGDVPDTDIPAAGLLANAETMLDGEPFYTPARHGQYWLSVPLGGKKTVACRAFIPKGLTKEKPVPVVVSLHGAGVNANMWFESYGAGQIVRECRERGWVLIAPDNGLGFTSPPVDRILEKLGERYPIDPKRVFLVGHSMGARQALTLAESGKFAAVAALGGGGRITKPKAFSELPMFVGVGTEDSLAFTGARAMRKSLLDGEVKNLTYREYRGIEHLLIVRVALPDAFIVFDNVAKK